MECTQRLEFTQELCESRSEKSSPEQIGFVGICGTKYPVKFGPNKIGRDPQTCNIVLQLNSISRQHAVINVLNKTEFMLMDLDSANKTKLMDKILQPYIPHALRNGDMVQFGDVFGVFRLLEEDTDLPMTQALDIPETPITSRHITRINNVPITTIPESPDVSDKDDSFIAPSQPKGNRPFRNSNTNYIKQSATTISIQPIGSNQIDNIYWKSSKKSTSIGSHFDNSHQSLNDSTLSLKSTNNQTKDMTLHEMETQPLDIKHNENADSIYTANTQIPIANCSPSIHSMSTQLPVGADNLPEVCKISNQHEMQFNLFPKNTNDNIFNAETQQCVPDNEQIFPIKLNLKSKKISTAENCNSRNIHDADTQYNKAEKETIAVVPKYRDRDVLDKEFKDSSKTLSEEEIIFEEMNEDMFQDNFESQSLLPESPNKDSKKVTVMSDFKENDPEVSIPLQKINIHRKSDSSTDCEDIEIIPTQQLPEQPLDEDITDCEDELNESKTKHNSKVNFEDLLTQIIDENDDQNIETMNTQLVEDIESNTLCVKKNPLNVQNISRRQNDEIEFEDLPTQILNHDIPQNKVVKLEISNEISPFKIPLQSPIKIKRKDISVVSPLKEPVSDNIETNGININDNNDNNYYAATQEILDDLCTEAQHSPEIIKQKSDKTLNNNDIHTKATTNDIDIVPCSVEEYETHDRLPGLDTLSPRKGNVTFNRSFTINDDVIISPSNLSSQQIREVIGVEVVKPTKMPSDSSDVDVTPKKKPFRFLDIDLPDSQEIKTSVTLKGKDAFSESSSDSETEIDSEEQHTPILLRRNERSKTYSKQKVKQNLSNKLNIDDLPSRVMSRIRKPSSKIQNADPELKNILKPKFLTEQDDNISEDIINENISRLKKDNEKIKNNKKQSEINLKLKSNAGNVYNVKDNMHSNKKRKDSEKKESKKHCNQKNKDDLQKNINITSVSKIKGNAEKIVNDLQIDSNIEKRKRSTRSSRKKEEKPENKIYVKVKEKKMEMENDNLKQPLENKTHETSQKRAHQNTDKVLLTKDEKEVRRSKRQRSYKEKKENDSIIKVKITKPQPKNKPVQHEKSKVYSISSESDTDVPVRLKRFATEAPRAPSPKRTRSAGNVSLRATPARMLRTQYVLFTAFPCEEVKMKLENLGAIIVTEVAACSVLLTLNIRRTFKLLCAVGLGKPIVGADWVQACADTKMIVDPWLHLIKDEAAETRFKFSLEKTLRSKRNFLKGYNISSTPNVMPNASEMKLIVECSGGSWKEGGSNWMCVSCSADKSLWPSLRQRGAFIVSTEFILGGVLRQKLDVTNSKLG
ncbi:uncharacterized protein LOC131842157 [Achroia grisella]|uniref:uncharacterized protein LOC131842157 n=1 Tax=Achroia grisella TaxID=688607 RepID=UPI0027D30717|nr:uncharacterized protein LOC131842157 [Achroia grisella]